MPEKKQDSFTVTDRRLFTSEGELRSEVPAPEPEPERPKAAAAVAPKTQEPPPTTAGEHEEAPPPPTAAEQKEQHDAYRKSSRELDTRVELSGHSAKELEMTFERFM